MTVARPDPVHDTRERAYRWEDPASLARALVDSDGLSFLRRMVDGTLPPPPIMATLGAQAELVESGHVVFALDPGEFHYNPIGSVHGGVFAFLLDSAAGCAVHSTLPRGARYTSLDLDVKFLRKMTVETGRVRCTGRVVHSGRQTVLARAEITDGEGRLLAEATSSCLVQRP